MKSEKKFDCLAFKRQVQTQIYEDIRGMTFDQEAAYFQRPAEQGKLGAWWKRVKAAGNTS